MGKPGLSFLIRACLPRLPVSLSRSLQPSASSAPLPFAELLKEPCFRGHLSRVLLFVSGLICLSDWSFDPLDLIPHPLTFLPEVPLGFLPPLRHLPSRALRERPQWPLSLILFPLRGSFGFHCLSLGSFLPRAWLLSGSLPRSEASFLELILVS